MFCCPYRWSNIALHVHGDVPDCADDELYFVYNDTADAIATRYQSESPRCHLATSVAGSEGNGGANEADDGADNDF